MHQTQFGCGFAPDPTGEAYSAPPGPLAGFTGPTSNGRKGGKGRDGKGRKMKGVTHCYSTQWRHSSWCHPGRQIRVSSQFFPEITDNLFLSSTCVSSTVSSLFYFSLKTGDLFPVTVIFIAFTRMSPPPPRRCNPTHFYLSDLASPLFFVNSATKKIFLRVSNPWSVSPGAVRPLASLVTPLIPPSWHVWVFAHTYHSTDHSK